MPSFRVAGYSNNGNMSKKICMTYLLTTLTLCLFHWGKHWHSMENVVYNIGTNSIMSQYVTWKLDKKFLFCPFMQSEVMVCQVLSGEYRNWNLERTHSGQAESYHARLQQKACISSVVQIRRGNRNNLGITFLIAPYKYILWPLIGTVLSRRF